MPPLVPVVHSRDHDILAKGHAPEMFAAKQHANSARQRSEKDMVLATSNINTEYKKRLDETRELTSRMQAQLEAVRQELTTLGSSREKLMALLVEVQRPLQLTLDWVSERQKLRCDTPSADTIQRALGQTKHDLKATIDALAGELIRVDLAVNGLRKAEKQFCDEIKNNESIMVLDRACMSGVTIGTATTGSQKLHRALMSPQGLRTENEWRNHAFACISFGVAAIEEALACRKHLAALIADLNASGKTKRPAVVVDALVAHSKYQQQQISSLQYNLNMVTAEISTLDTHLANTAATLNKVRQQMQHTTQRLSLQIVRPVIESSRTGAEETLEIEFINLQRTEKNLTAQIKELEAKKAIAVALRHKIETELQMRSTSLELDRKCTGLALPSLPQISDRYRQPNASKFPSGVTASPRNEPASARRN